MSFDKRFVGACSGPALRLPPPACHPVPAMLNRKEAVEGTNMRSIVMIVGVIAALMGLLWIGQGMGIVRWPASSFMIDQSPWITRGAILAVIGLALVLLARRIR